MQGRFAISRRFAGLVALVAGLALPQAAEAAIPSALGVTCAEQGDGVRFCGSARPAQHRARLRRRADRRQRRLPARARARAPTATTR